MANSSNEVQTITVYQPSHPVSTVSGNVVSIPTSYLSQPATNSRSLGPLLTGTCTVPYFADVTNQAGVVLRYPQIGCSPDLLDCCPFTFQDNISLVICPADHYSVARGSYTACCPSNFGLLYTGIGFQTPCYSNLSTYLVPEETPSPNVWLATDTLFARSYQLVRAGPDVRPSLNGPALGGLIAGLVFAVCILLAVLLWWILRRRHHRPHAVPTRGKDAEAHSPFGMETKTNIALPKYSPNDLESPPATSHLDVRQSWQTSAPEPVELAALGPHPSEREMPFQSSLKDIALSARGPASPHSISVSDMLQTLEAARAPTTGSVTFTAIPQSAELESPNEKTDTSAQLQ